jgi:exopolysaccharide production protein ExoQ
MNIKPIENVFVVCSLVLYTDAFFSLLFSGGYSEGEGLEALQSNSNGFLFGLLYRAFLLIGMISFLLMIPYLSKVISVVIANKYIFLFSGLVVASNFWSNYHKVIIEIFSFLCTYSFAIYFSVRYTFKEQLILLSRAFLIILIFSILFIALLPKYGIMAGVHTGVWRGVFAHKNHLGKFMVLSSIIFIIRYFDKEQRNRTTYFGLIISIFLCVMAQSSSSLGNLLSLILFLIIIRIWRWRLDIMIPASIGTLLIASIFQVWYQENAEIIFSLVGKDATLSGRTEMWDLIYEIGLRRMWLGYGYLSFWRGFNSPAAEVWYAHDWLPPDGHNGFLDLFVTLGFVGLIIFILGLLESFWKGFIWLRYVSNKSDGFWPLVFLLFLVISNLAESSLMKINSLDTVLFISISYSLTIVTSKNYRLNYNSPSNTIIKSL